MHGHAPGTRLQFAAYGKSSCYINLLIWTRSVCVKLPQVPLHLHWQRISWSKVAWETLGFNLFVCTYTGENGVTHTHMQPATKPCWTQGCLVSCDSRDPTLCGQGRLRLIALHVYWNLIKLHSPNKNTCMQEMEWQGMGPMKGLCDSLKRSGTHGRHPQNIKRDMLRTLGNRNPSCTVPGQNLNLLEECAELNCKTKWFWCICKM